MADSPIPTHTPDGNPAGRPRLASQVVRHVLDSLQRLALRPGDAMPSELQLGRDLGVSRGSVREAYRALAALGILEIENGRRPRLAVVSPRVLADVFDYALTTSQVTLAHVLETRRAIELQNAQLAARFATAAQRERLRALANEMRAAGEDHERRIACDTAIHTVIAEASGNPLNDLLLGSLRSPLEESARLHLGARRSASEIVRVIDAHEAVVERICAGDPVGAASAMSIHFDLALVHVNRQGDAGTLTGTDT